jgi:hypothetical protein
LRAVPVVGISGREEAERFKVGSRLGKISRMY